MRIYRVAIIATFLFGGNDMSDKYLKEIVKELRLIRVELQKITSPKEVTEPEVQHEIHYDDLKNMMNAKAGEKVTFK